MRRPTPPQADFLVIGSGVAGLRAALDLSREGRVIMLTKGHPLQSASIFAQGGVAVALSEEDDVAIHLTDTVRAGHGLCRREAVRVLVEEGPDRIQELIRWGAKFDKAGGKFAFAREAAHSRSRILRARGDATGNEMVRVLMAQAHRQKRIHRMDFHFTVDLVVEDGRCCGAVVLDEHSGEQFILPAKAVVLSTGGAGQIYARTTNPPNATGDGMAMAFRAGALLQDMEFVQFHPTALFLPSSPPFLLSEAMRGEGGQLRNHKGEAFMQRYHPLGAMAPRDIVARAIWAEMAATKSRHVYLDVTHLGADFVKRRFPTIYSTCLRYDIDITEEWIPVSPSAHYMMGGVWTDLNGATTLPGLFAAGEVACSGVHGANRLASNSLLEGLVFGMRAGVAAVAWAARQTLPDLSGQVAALRQALKHRLDDTEKMRNSLRRTMWGQVGIIRSRESLVRATAQLSRWEHMISKSFAGRADLEVKNMVQVAHCVAEAALWRENSVGAHFRSDIPESKRPGWKQHSQLSVKKSVIGQERQKHSGQVVALQSPKTQSRGRLRQGLA
ncbi:MAG: L-aspartate oxidase [Nitrospiraceae bacterium]|jgi:L-aspartate oxidase|uniref:L-aspartate oxidase n=1 Tax=Nitrospira cf. moscoviensis SBR1015 TaxID=96242 RepID=UPI000B3BB2E3|nr:L-aspartate oxidase [Nitrospira cf. moscoviensis SBR1015]MBY0248907.1 L-aspartate oxidase [Nitrospiraceae bacterium]